MEVAITVNNTNSINSKLKKMKSSDIIQLKTSTSIFCVYPGDRFLLSPFESTNSTGEFKTHKILNDESGYDQQ